MKSYTIPTASQAARVSRPSATPPPPPLSSSLPSTSGGPRTIWDSEFGTRGSDYGNRSSEIGSWTPPPTSSFVPHRDYIEPTRPGSILPTGRRSSSGSRSLPYSPKTSNNFSVFLIVYKKWVRNWKPKGYVSKVLNWLPSLWRIQQSINKLFWSLA